MDSSGRTGPRAQGSPDIMNDPAYNPGRGDKGKGVDEPDTCRICRGEGTEGDELFYPCKCSGSIKFVHQGCLTEWLSHSQKKYCELCKTPFQFTKLYDPNMPQELPVPVFLKELVIHGCRTLLTWLRFVLVAFVWLGWLPWSMRALWRGLFWLADGRWPGASDGYSGNGVTTTDGMMAQGTSPATSTLASNAPTGSTNPASIATAIPHILAPVSSMLNFSDGEPLIYSMAKSLLTSTFVASTPSTDSSATSPAGANETMVRRLRHPSWLSDISYLNNLTRYPTLNNIIIDTLEGQLITLLVVTSFILVFLIREWVVQQQPVLNLAEGEREVAARIMAEEFPARHDVEPGQNEGQEDDSEDSETQEVPGLDPGTEEGADANETTPVIGPLPNTEFHVPDSASARPRYPSAVSDHDSVQPSPSRGDDLRVGQSTNEDIPEGSQQTVADFIRRQKESESYAFPQSEASADFWNIHENTPESGRNRHPDVGSASSSITPEAQRYSRATADVNETPDNSEVINPPQSGFDMDLPPTALNFLFGEVGPPGPSRGQSSPFLETPPPGPSTAAPASDKKSESHNHGDITPVGPHGQPTEHLEAQAPLTPISLDHESEAEVNDEQGTAAPTSEETLEMAQEQEIADDQRMFAERVANWLWGDIPVPDPRQQEQQQQQQEDNDDEEEEVNDDERLADDPQQRPAVRHQNGNIDEHDRGAAPGGADERNDPEAVEDADDLEGILELIGMQGPIFGLLQNGVFSALLIAFTVSIGIWLPYMCGKIGLVLLTNPIRFLVRVPLMMVSIAAGVALDTVIGSFAFVVYVGSVILRMPMKQLGLLIPSLQRFSESNAVVSATSLLMTSSAHRLKRIMLFVLTSHESGRPTFSMLSRQALKIHQARISSASSLIFRIIRGVVYDVPVLLLTTGDYMPLLKHIALSIPSKVLDLSAVVVSGIRDVASTTADILNTSYLTTVADEDASLSLDPDLARWDTKDRVVAIIVGYCLATLAGLVYLRIAHIFNGIHHQRQVNGAVAESLRQAGGVMKVVLIIGIEMIVFPLYCGVLLDIALLPLFETATVVSRLNFTRESPLTSLFVHWFVGTCYMFHFALFVSMCRKILRRGVLYFIRDPDDPTFHPVRDVLERSIATQLRKIAFSALVYGALVIVCLGGVVWGLYYFAKGVLPLHWSSNEPVLEFPVDLLFYNFVFPLAIRSIKPSDSLHQMYEWWFQKCARLLRLSDFLFGERKPDEEGNYANRTWYEALSVVAATLASAETEPHTPAAATEKHDREDNAGFVRNGRFVRTPGSDQVRIPKGAPVFVEVNENNERADGKPDRDAGLHGKTNDMFTKVYVPPSFRARISSFIFLIWAFAAVTGIGTTILPLLLGRRMLASLFPAHVRVNDIYAFSAGICVVGSLAYAAVHYRQVVTAVARRLRPNSRSPARVVSDIWDSTCYAFRLAYAVVALALFFPSVFALLSELYVLLPLHTYLHGDEAHVIHFIQDWTLGVLYLRMALRFISWHRTSRLAVALNAITRDGVWNPDMKLATRAFIIPAFVISLAALVGPLSIGFLLKETVFRDASPAMHSQVYRYCYPAYLLALLAIVGGFWLKRQISVWRVSIRDDVYLIGERLHNFGGRGAMDVGVTRRMMT